MKEKSVIFPSYSSMDVAMSVAKAVKKQIATMEAGKPFNVKALFGLGGRRAVDCALARLVSEGTVIRVNRGVYMRPKSSKYVRSVVPKLSEVVQVIAERTGERIDISGAEAARRLGLTTQVPMAPVFYTSGSTRELTVNNQRVKLKHVADRKLALAGTSAGLALSALWYLGKGEVNHEMLNKVEAALPGALGELQAANVPGWLLGAIDEYQQSGQMAS